MSGKVKKFVSVLSGKVDITCDECNGRMRPGGHYKLEAGGKSHQFCSEKCMDAYDAKIPTAQTSVETIRINAKVS